MENVVAKNKDTMELVLSLSTLLIVLVVAHLGARMVWLLLDGAPLPSSQLAVATVPSKQVGPVSSKVDISNMTSWNIFGAENVEQVEVVQEVPVEVDVPDTSLDLHLEGISASPDIYKASAIIAEKKGAEGEIFWVGDSVYGKALLKSVHEDKVIIKIGERLETLRFAEGFNDSGSSSMPSIGGSSSNSDRSKGIRGVTESQRNHSDMLKSYRDRLNSRNKEARDFSQAFSSGSENAVKDLVDSYGPKLQNSIDNALRTSGIEQVESGLLVSHKAQSSWLSKVGLRRGDIVKSVNGHSPNVIKSDKAVRDKVLASCVAKIEVQRGQRTFIVTYPFC